MSQLQVLYEDNHLIAVNKQPGQLAQEDQTGDYSLGELVKGYLSIKYNKPGNVYLGVLHRLDRPVSGVTLFARTSKAAERMSKAFKERKIDKTYWAITSRRPKIETDVLQHFIRRSTNNNTSRAFAKAAPNAKPATLSYNLLGSLGKHHLLEVKPTTGRHHQIRVQLAKIGCPIKGDKKYGHAEFNKDKSIHLHAHSLSFIHPVQKERMTITAWPPLKDDVWRMFEGFL